MRNRLIIAAMAFAVSSGGSWAADPGETSAQAYRLQHPNCNEVPRFGSNVEPVGQVTGDPDLDTYALPVVGTDIVCSDGTTAH